MRTFRILTTLLVALIMIFGLISCDNNDESSSSSEESSSEQSSSSSSSEESSSEESSSSSSEQSSSEEEDDGMWKSNASQEVIEKAEALLDSKIRLTYNEDGSFKVLILADLHVDVAADPVKAQRVSDRVKEIVDRVDPDLCIMTGDNTIHSSTNEKLKANLEMCIGYLEEKEIPWCHVYGNHDHEGALANSLQQGVHEQYEFCVSKAGTIGSRPGTYALGIYNADGSLGSVIWCLNSGAYDNVNGGYAYISQKQIDWYKENSELLEEYNNGEKVKGMMAFHIPLIENETAYQNRDNKELVYEYDGGRNEAMCPSKTDTTLYETALERGDIVAIVTGHDHVNDYMYNYQGIKLCSSPNLGEQTYYNDILSGSRVFDLNTETLDDIPTYVEYLMDRGGRNVDDYELLMPYTMMHDFENGMPSYVMSGWSAQSLEGNVFLEIKDGKGVGGSKALEVKRDKTGNYEFVLDFEGGKLHESEYLIVWMDFTDVELRKGCVGLVGNDGVKHPFRTDDYDTTTTYYYRADGQEDWTAHTLGGDGCFGSGDSSSVKGKKGYFAFSLEKLRQGAKSLADDELITGFYFYGSFEKDDPTYIDVPLYIDDVMLAKTYENNAYIDGAVEDANE